MDNPYVFELSPAEIAAGRHRQKVGGRWDEIGRLQLEFLKEKGLRPTDALLDIGCGALRAGLHFMQWLAPGGYYGLDFNASLLEAGRMEMNSAGLADRRPQLLLTDRFECSSFGRTFRFMLANSVFTHLPLNSIERCLVEAARALAVDGRFFASYFDAPHWPALGEVRHLDNIVTHSDRNPYHYHFSVFEHLASRLQLQVERQLDWGHPRGMAMLIFSHAGRAGAR